MKVSTGPHLKLLPNLTECGAHGSHCIGQKMGRQLPPTSSCVLCLASPRSLRATPALPAGSGEPCLLQLRQTYSTTDA